MKGFVTFVAATLAVTMGGAAKANFFACDGYPAPTKGSDGMTSQRGVLGIGSTTADYRRGLVLSDESRIETCDSALADPLLLPKYWVRRAHLIQAKALHQIAAGKDAEALTTLAESDAVGSPQRDAMFDGSIGLGNLALRAVAYFRLGRSNEGRQAVVALRNARPYSSSIRLLARRIELMFLSDLDRAFQITIDDAPYDPALIAAVFDSRMATGDYAKALELAPDLAFYVPVGSGKFASESPNGHAYEDVGERKKAAWAAAYARVALGRGTLAEAVPAGAAVPVWRGAESNFSNEWQLAIALRVALAGKTFPEAAEALRVAKTRMAALPDILAQLASDPATKAVLDSMLAETRKQKESEWLEAVRGKPGDLFGYLPRPETPSMRPKVAARGPSIFIGEGMKGFAMSSIPGTDLLEVDFGSNQATGPLVEEAAFLVVADLMRKRGADSFVVVAARRYQRTMRVQTTTWLGTPKGTVPVNEGYEFRMIVRPVNAAALPEDLKDSGWRILRADDVLASLEPRLTPSRRR